MPRGHLGKLSGLLSGPHSSAPPEGPFFTGHLQVMGTDLTEAAVRDVVCAADGTVDPRAEYQYFAILGRPGRVLAAVLLYEEP